MQIYLTNNIRRAIMLVNAEERNKQFTGVKAVITG